jgi:hypothetical protein
MGDGQDGAVIITWGPIPLSNICFPAGTPIKTDQGIVPIQFLCPSNHTINSLPIQHITSTLTIDPYLISFEPHSIRHNYPSQTTIMTKDHQVLFEGQLVPAYRFLDYSNKVKKVAYSGEVLYNVLLPVHSTLSVNNMVCETLHPDNIIAKLYTSNISHTYKNEVIALMNDSLKKKDINTYKTIINRL